MINTKKNRIRKIIFLLTTYFTIVFTVKANTNSKNKQIPYNEIALFTILPYDSYSNGNVYISDFKTIKAVIIDSNDVYIIDERNDEDPNICICNSYKIKSIKDIKEITDIILKYEKENPSSWNRSKESLINEWILHNMGYIFDIKRQRTMNVDFNNNDENKYKTMILKK